MTLRPLGRVPQIGGTIGLKLETSGNGAVSELCAKLGKDGVGTGVISKFCVKLGKERVGAGAVSEPWEKSGKERGPLLLSGELAESGVVVAPAPLDISESEKLP